MPNHFLPFDASPTMAAVPCEINSSRFGYSKRTSMTIGLDNTATTFTTRIPITTMPLETAIASRFRECRIFNKEFAFRDIAKYQVPQPAETIAKMPQPKCVIVAESLGKLRRLNKNHETMATTRISSTVNGKNRRTIVELPSGVLTLRRRPSVILAGWGESFIFEVQLAVGGSCRANLHGGGDQPWKAYSRPLLEQIAGQSFCQ